MNTGLLVGWFVTALLGAVSWVAFSVVWKVFLRIMERFVFPSGIQIGLRATRWLSGGAAMEKWLSSGAWQFRDRPVGHLRQNACAVRWVRWVSWRISRQRSVPGRLLFGDQGRALVSGLLLVKWLSVLERDMAVFSLTLQSEPKQAMSAVLQLLGDEAAGGVLRVNALEFARGLGDKELEEIVEYHLGAGLERPAESHQLLGRGAESTPAA